MAEGAASLSLMPPAMDGGPLILPPAESPSGPTAAAEAPSTIAIASNNTSANTAAGAYGRSPPYAGVSVRSYATGGATNAGQADATLRGGVKAGGAVRIGVDVDAAALATSPGSRSAPPPRRVSPPLTTSACPSALTPPPARSAVVLPPLPPLLPFGASPNFTPLQPQPRNFSNSNLSLSQSPTGTVAPLLSFPSPAHSPALQQLRQLSQSPSLAQQQSMFLQSPPLTFRPTSPAVPNLSLGTPSMAGSARTPQGGAMCTCKNDPSEQGAPCNCSVSHTPLLMAMAPRPLVQSQSMDAFMLSRSSSGAGGVAPGPTASGWSSLASSPHHAPLGSGRRHPSMSMSAPYPSPSGASSHSLATTLSAASSAASLSLLANGQSRGLSSLNSSGSGSHSAQLASMGMVQASQVPTAPHAGVTINIYTNQPHAHLLPTPLATTPLDTQHSIFSPSAPADVVARMQRQASVSPADYSDTTTGSPPEAAGANAAATARPVHTINIHAPSTPSTPTAASTNMPLTASTVRLLRRAMRALRGLFPSADADPESPGAAAAATAAGTAGLAVPSAASSADPSPRLGATPRQLSPKHSLPPLPPLHSLDRSPSQSSRARYGPYSSSNSAPPVAADSPRVQRVAEAETAAAEMRVALVRAQHSQTCAVWTHMLGAAWMATRWGSCDGTLALQLQSAGFSALFASGAFMHMFAPAPVTSSWSNMLARVDRCGLSAAAALGGVATALTHFDSAGEQSQRCATMALNAALGLISIRTLWQPTGSKTGQLSLLVLQALLCAFPALREHARSGDRPLRALLRRSLLLATLCGVVAALLYIRRLPERLNPPPSKLVHPPAQSERGNLGASFPVYFRFVSWLGQLGVRSSHLMHVCGVLAAHVAFAGLRDWSVRKQHLALTVQRTLAGAYA